MSDSLRHECGIALVRLTKDLKWYQEKYGTPLHGFNQLFLLMEKQHNRGQDGAGIGCVKIGSENGEAFLFRDREIGAQGLTQIFTRQIKAYSDKMREAVIVPEFPETVKRHFDFGGELLLGHLRYGTSGNFDSVSCHPYARKSIWPTRNLLVAGNFNLTNTAELNASLTQRGAHVIYSTDTQSILEEIGFWLDEEHDRLFKAFKDQGLEGAAVQAEISKHMDIGNVLRRAAKNWDGGYAIAGLVGNGDSFVIRDPNGIRPCWYARTEDLIAVASERVALMTIVGVSQEDVHELPAGHALIMKADGRHSIESFHAPGEIRHCSFERIYFSRGNDPEIYAERKALGAALADDVLAQIRDDHDNAVFSYIPNTAEIAWYGLMEELRKRRRAQVSEKLIAAQRAGKLDEAMIEKLVLGGWPRGEKVAHKDVKLRTFISQEKNRMQMASHVYDISYGTVREGDTLVCVDDSIVRGTTLRQSILRILARPNPKRIVIASTAPQIRYPDCYGIDMSEMGKFLAFQAAVALCKERGMADLLREVYEDCVAQAKKPTNEMRNHVKRIYDAFTEEEIAAKAAELVYPAKSGWKGELVLVFQKIASLHKACPSSRGDWYFTGDYPTPGGLGVLNQAYINYWEKREGRSY
ncbi:MAG: amidophosphoribosyltransferase [Opitutia bacterium Tous-C2FEB]|jgi:amidophosphoribosyltransferase|nr:MAG: amidophosphoribosyltransferase [Opitutae bacterium Tous-C2FEB]